MSTETNRPQEKKNSDFGLPQAEFSPIPESGGNWLRIIAIILVILLIIGAGAAYWFFYHAPASSREEAYLDTNEIATSDEFIEDNALTAPPTASEAQKNDKMHDDFGGSMGVQEAEIFTNKAEQKTFSNQPSKKPAKGAITKIDTPQGFYYIIVGSFVDGDLASDYANQLAKQGTDTTILAPEPGEYFHRVAVAQADTLYAAHEEVEELKATYGNKIWVKKY
ncbi:MAG: SPOR domain-containing protein [Bacteroidota bacterium]